MTDEEKSTIEQFRQLIPVRVGLLATQLGLGVLKSTLHPGISGLIEPSKDFRSGFVIRINRHEVKERQRFTISHEIGHYVLHRERIGLGITDTILYRSKLSSNLEVEANRFAAQLLMPMNRIKEYLEQFNGRRDRSVVTEMARIFEVSADAMEIRLGLR